MRHTSWASASRIVAISTALVLTTALLPVFGVEGSATTYFVAPNGSNSSSGSEGAPWRTIGYGLTRLAPGQTLLVRGGRYVENIKNPSIAAGRSDARIRVAAFPGERPVIEGLLWLTRPSYWTISGINVTWSTANGQTDHMVKMTNGMGWVYENSELWGARSFGALLVAGTVRAEPANWVVRGNCLRDVWTDPIHHTNGDHNLYINTGTSAGAGLVERNVLFNAPNGQNIKIGYGRSDPQPGDGSANVTVRYNTMYSSLKNISVADDTHSVLIERNIIQRSAEGYAIRAYRLTGTNNVFRDNVFHDFRLNRLQYGDSGYKLLTDGGGNLFPRDPKFDAVGCDNLRPGDTTAQAYGHLAALSGTAPTPTPPPTPTPMQDLGTPGIPRPSLVQGSALWGGELTIRTSWRAAERVPSGTRYQLQLSRDGGTYRNVRLSERLSTSAIQTLAPGHWYRHRVRLRSDNGYAGSWTYGAMFRVAVRQEGARSVQYSADWQQKSCSRCSGGVIARAAAKGSEARFTIRGAQVAWVATRGPRMGVADIFVDGVFVTTVDLHAAIRQPRRVIFTHRWDSSGTHVVTIRTRSDRPVTLDAFVILKG